MGIDARQAVVHQQQASLDGPDGKYLHLLRYKHHLGAKSSLADVFGRECRGLIWVDEVAVCVRYDVHADNQDSVRGLCWTSAIIAPALIRVGGACAPWRTSSTHRLV